MTKVINTKSVTSKKKVIIPKTTTAKKKVVNPKTTAVKKEISAVKKEAEIQEYMGSSTKSSKIALQELKAEAKRIREEQRALRNALKEERKAKTEARTGTKQYRASAKAARKQITELNAAVKAGDPATILRAANTLKNTADELKESIELMLSLLGNAEPEEPEMDLDSELALALKAAAEDDL